MASEISEFISLSSLPTNVNILAIIGQLSQAIGVKMGDISDAIVHSSDNKTSLLVFLKIPIDYKIQGTYLLYYYTAMSF